MKILWIEDDYSRLKGLMRPLEKRGFLTDHALDYPSYLKKIKSQDYDLFVVDLILPQKDAGKTLSEEEFVSLPGMKIVDEIDKIGKPIVVLTVVTEPDVHAELKSKRNVKKILTKGNIFPSDFMEDVLEILGIDQEQLNDQ